MKNKYELIAEAIETAFLNQELQVRIQVGSTDTMRWDDVIEDNASTDSTVFCVLSPNGGSSVKTNAGLVKSEYLTLAMALPNPDSTTYGNTLAKIEDAMSSFISQPLEVNNEIYQFGDNGLNPLDYRTIKGHDMGIVIQNLVYGTATEMLEAAGAIVKVKLSANGDEETLFGMLHYTYGFTNNYDSFEIKGENETKKTFRSVLKSLTVEFYKIKENELQQEFANPSVPYYYISLNDGDQDLLLNKEMYLQDYTQDGVIGGYVSVRAVFTSGVVK